MRERIHSYALAHAFGLYIRKLYRPGSELVQFTSHWCRQRAALFEEHSIAKCYDAFGPGDKRARTCYCRGVCPFCFFRMLQGIYTRATTSEHPLTLLYRPITLKRKSRAPEFGTYGGYLYWTYLIPGERTKLAQCAVISAAPGTWRPPLYWAGAKKLTIPAGEKKKLWSALLTTYRWPLEWFSVKPGDESVAVAIAARGCQNVRARISGYFLGARGYATLKGEENDQDTSLESLNQSSER